MPDTNVKGISETTEVSEGKREGQVLPPLDDIKFKLVYNTITTSTAAECTVLLLKCTVTSRAN